MSLVSAWISANQIHNIEQALGAKDVTSFAMQQAVTDWYNLYYDSEPKEDEDPSQRLPFTIVSKLYKAIFSEYKALAAKSDAQAAFITELLTGLDAVRKRAVQQMLIGGQCYLKPLIGKPLTFAIVDRQNYMPLERNVQGYITDIGTSEQTQVGQTVYTLLERRSVDGKGYLTIESRLYKSDDKAALGTEVPLSTLEKYAALEPVLRLPVPLYSTGLIPFICPLSNCVDGSPDAVSVYAAAAGLIHSINRNEAQINAEFENGASRIIASSDLLSRDKNGRKRLNDRLFTAIDDDPESVGITIFSPELREQNYLNRKTEYLRNIEALIGLKRGLLSEVEAVEKTATEITSSAGEYNLTVIDFQEAWESTVKEAVRVCGLLGQMYHLCSGGIADPEQAVTISWGNGILYDEDQVWTDYKAMVAAGMLKPEIALGWYFDMPTETAADLQRIREKYMPDVIDADDGTI